MSESEPNLQQLDAAYKPFPTFKAWESAQEMDFSRWNRETALLADRATSSSDLLDRARHVATRAAAIDTGAIEDLYEADRGFTYSVAFETTGWELEVSARGEQVRPLFEAQLKAYEYVLTLATGAEPISEAAIRELHLQICSAQDTYRVETPIGPREQALPKGVYKSLPNHVRTRRGANHSYAPVDVTPSEVHRLVLEMRKEIFLSAHPVSQAAYVHYCFVVIHPFADGNGRVARALASAFTYRAISIPIVILTDEKNAYLDALEQADLGDHGAFTKFMLNRSLDSAQLVLDGLEPNAAETPQAMMAKLNSLFESPVLLRSDIDELGKALVRLLEATLERAAKKFSVTGRIKLEAKAGILQASGLPAEYRGFEVHAFAIGTEASSADPAAASVTSVLIPWLPQNAESDSEILMVDQKGLKVFSARIDQLHPGISGVLQLRAEFFSERYWGSQLSLLEPLAEQALNKKR